MQIDRRDFLQKAGACALGGMTGFYGFVNRSHANEAHRSPNIILIVADDLGYGDLGCYGQKNIQTPRLDQMAEEGMRFTQHYAGCTVCAPSRCSLMTGLHTGRCTVRGNEEILMRPDEPTLGAILKQAGYQTACIGKWGIGHICKPEHPKQHGFDEFFGYLSMWHAHNYYPDYLWRNAEKVPLKNVVKHPDKHYKPTERLNVGVATKKVEYSHDLFTQEALQFINRNKEKPFFLYLPYTIPHANNEAGDKGMETPDYGVYKDKNWPEAQKGHAAMITRMDRDIGKILDALRDLKLDRNTLVIFTSDNGPHKEGGVDPSFNDSNGPLKGKKRDLYEGGIRIPMIAWQPGRIKAGSVSHHISAFWDYLPTFQELVGDSSKIDTDGVSFAPTLHGQNEQQKEHDYLYWEFHEQGGKQAVRMEDWKGVRFYKNGERFELYNLKKDLGEENNLVVKRPRIVTKIKKIMDEAHTNDKRWPLGKK